jgi:pimeloyl-[acyl-carrier protein] synthase
VTSIEPTLQDRLLAFIGDPQARIDPYPFYRELRAASPVVRSPDGTWWVLSYDGCISLTRDKRWTHQDPNAPASGCPMGLARRMVGSMILFRDPPDHTRLRNLLGRVFIMPAAERKRAEFRAHIEEILAAAAAAGTVDFKEAIARLIPIYMICDVVGLPQERYEDLVRWSDSYASMLSVDVTPAMEAAADADFAEFAAYLAPIIAARRREPKDDLISEWIVAHEQGVLQADEIASFVLFTLTGGQSTTTTTMTNGLYTLFAHPDEWRRLCADPEGLKRTATDEILRYESAGRALVPRWATEDVQLGGALIRKGEMVIGLDSAANRDPAVFPDPDRFDIARKPNRHLAFGEGIHICPGQFVARVEIQELIAAIAANYPDVTVGTPGDWMPDWILRGLTSLPMTLGRSVAAEPAL